MYNDYNLKNKTIVIRVSESDIEIIDEALNKYNSNLLWCEKIKRSGFLRKNIIDSCKSIINPDL